MYGDFFLYENDDEQVSTAERLAFGNTSGRNEAWLRDTLYGNPKIMPIRDIDPSFSPLVPLCTELRTEAGPLDIAFINREGRLTLVECKLWRNPEARRKVVAQVLDYARAISKWSYSDLQRQVSAATGSKGNRPYEAVKANYPDLDEARFIDDTYRAMRNGRFLLLIAGDGIREDVNAIAELINRNAASGFSFGLIEIALYGLEDGGLMVQPRTIAKTKIIEKTVVILQNAEEIQLGPSPVGETNIAFVSKSSGENSLGESPKQAEYRAWWEPVVNTVFDDPDQESPTLYWPNHTRTPLQIPGVWITAYRVGGPKGSIGVGTAGRSSADCAFLSRLQPYKSEILESLPKGSEYKLTYKGDGYCYGVTRGASDFESEERKWLAETLNSYVNVFRPLAEKIIREDESDKSIP
jgi:hypothetical protein